MRTRRNGKPYIPVACTCAGRPDLRRLCQLHGSRCGRCGRLIVDGINSWSLRGRRRVKHYHDGCQPFPGTVMRGPNKRTARGRVRRAARRHP